MKHQTPLSAFIIGLIFGMTMLTFFRTKRIEDLLMEVASKVAATMEGSEPRTTDDR